MIGLEVAGGFIGTNGECKGWDKKPVIHQHIHSKCVFWQLGYLSKHSVPKLKYTVTGCKCLLYENDFKENMTTAHDKW